MKPYLLFFLTVTILSSFASPALSEDKVVVIPLNSTKLIKETAKLKNVVTVSAQGGDFTDPVEAVNSITDAAEANPYLVLIGPGAYTLTKRLIIKPYVTVAGSGQEVTALTGAISAGVLDQTSAIVTGGTNTVLRDLTITNTGGGGYSIALFLEGGSPIIKNITSNAYGGLYYSYAVYNQSSSPTMISVIASAYGNNFNRAVWNNYSTPIMTDVIAIASAGEQNFAITNNFSHAKMTDVTATASGGTTLNIGLHNVYASPSINGGTIAASGGTENYGMYNDFSTPVIRNCTIEGTTNGIIVAEGTVRLLRSSIIGNALIHPSLGGTLTCVNSDDGVDSELNPDCTLPSP